MDNLRSLVESRGRLSPGGLIDLVVSKAANDVWQPRSRLICGSWEALDSINRRDLITVGITGLNCFLVLGPLSASWPCNHKDSRSLQERTYCSANTSTMNLPDSQFFLKETWVYDQYVSMGEQRKLLDLSGLIGNWFWTDTGLRKVWLTVGTGVRSNQKLHVVGGEKGHLTMV